MGKLLTIAPELHQPFGVLWRQGDEFNGHQRGEWWFRHPHSGLLKGPFPTELDADYTLEIERFGFVD